MHNFWFFALLCALIASPSAYARGPSNLERNAVWELPAGGIVPKSTVNLYVYFPGKSIYHGLSADTSTADFLKSVRFYIQRPFFMPDKGLRDKTPAVVSIEDKSNTGNADTSSNENVASSSKEFHELIMEVARAKDEDSASSRGGVKTASVQPAAAASIGSSASSGKLSSFPLEGTFDANGDSEDSNPFVDGSPEQDLHDYVNHLNGPASVNRESSRSLSETSNHGLDGSEAETGSNSFSYDSGVDMSADRQTSSSSASPKSDIELQKALATDLKHPAPVEQIELQPGEYRIAKVDMAQGVTEDNYIVPATEFYHLMKNVPEAFAEAETNMIYQVRLNVPDSFRHWVSKKLKFVIRSQRGFWIFKKKFAVSPAFPIVAARPAVNYEAERKACEALCLEGVSLNQCRTHGISECKPDPNLVLPVGVASRPPLTANQKKIKKALGEMHRDDFLELYKRIQDPKSRPTFQKLVDPLLVMQVYRQKYSKHAPRLEK